MLVIIAVAVVLVVTIALFWMRSHQPRSSSPTVDQQQTQVPAPAQPQTAQQQRPGNAPQAQPQSQAPTPSPAQDQAPATAPAQAPSPSTPERTPAAPASNGSVVKGAVAQRAQPDVLASASRTIHGTVNVRVRVNVGPDGNVSNATFDSAGPSRYFAKVAMQAAQQWKFKPAQVNGQPAASEWLLHFQFTRDTSDVTPVETTP
jgi:TonB family protein